MFGYHLKTTWVHIRRTPYQALAAVLITTLTFFVATILAVLAHLSTSMINYFETRPQVIAFLTEDAAPDNISLLQRRLEGDTRVKDVRYVSKEQAFEIYKTATSDNPLLSELVNPEVFPASLEFSVTDLSFAEQVVEELEQEGIVDQVAFTASIGSRSSLGTVISNLKKISNYIRVGGAAILGFLLSSSLVTLLVIVGMRISARRDEIDILKLIGATPGFIRMPFLLEGLFYGFFGALLGWLIGLILILYAAPSLASYFVTIDTLFTDTNALLVFFGGLLSIEAAAALILGTVGSAIALWRYLRL